MQQLLVFLDKIHNKFYQNTSVIIQNLNKFDGKKPEFIVAEDFDDLIKKSTKKF